MCVCGVCVCVCVCACVCVRTCVCVHLLKTDTTLSSSFGFEEMPLSDRINTILLPVMC